MINLNKPVQCRNGQKVRVICTNMKGPSPVIALIAPLDGKGNESLGYYTIQGHFAGGGGNHAFDLVQAKVARWRWITVKDGVLEVTSEHLSEQEAQKKYKNSLLGRAEATMREDDE